MSNSFSFIDVGVSNNVVSGVGDSCSLFVDDSVIIDVMFLITDKKLFLNQFYFFTQATVMRLSKKLIQYLHDIKILIMTTIVTKQNLNNNQKNMSTMSDAEVQKMMQSERMSLTCAPGGENNRGMEIIGRMPIKGEGFTADDIEKLGPYFKGQVSAAYKNNPVAVLDLNALSFDLKVDELPDEDQARVLILRNWIANWHGGLTWDREVYKNLATIRWDAEYLDPNKYRTEIVDGEEVKVRGRRMNKRARTNLCFVAGREQAPAVYEGKGTIYDLKKMTFLNMAVERLREDIAAGLMVIDSKTKVIINVVEGNRYYDLKTTGIGFHGDTERVVVICISIGGFNYPMRWQWFKDGMPVGKPIDIHLNSGDVYIMSEKAVGADWKLSSKYTLRHSAGAKKYRDLSKWEKRRPAHEARLKRRAEIKEERAAEKLAKKAAKSLKKTSPEIKKYESALKKHDWVDDDASFYKWVAIEANHDCSPDSAFFKGFLAIWTDKDMESFEKMNMSVWEEKRAFYRNLCSYGKYF
jgi:hypothetical protein